MEDFEADEEERYLASGLRFGPVAASVRERIRSEWRATPREQREETLQRLRLVGSYAEGVFRSEAYLASGDMAKWFALEHMSLDEILNAARSLPLPQPTTEEEDAAFDAKSERRHRMWDLEEQGYFGRTVEFDPKSSDWIFVRFGEVPESNRSVFGLGLSDAEGAQGDWRQESGNMTHEPGICVFRVHAHPGVHGAYVLMDPHYDLARYDVGGQTRHLLGVIPHTDTPDEVKAVKIGGHLKTINGMDGSLRCELGSDGEYLIDGLKPLKVESLELDQVWVSEGVSVRAFLCAHRKYEFENVSVPGM